MQTPSAKFSLFELCLGRNLPASLVPAEKRASFLRAIFKPKQPRFRRLNAKRILFATRDGAPQAA